MEPDVISITREHPELHIILCHGFGAGNQDLLDLAAWLDPGMRHDWHFPQAPFPIPGMSGFAWFPRTLPELLQTLNGEFFSHLETVQDPGLDASARELEAWIAAHGLPWDRLVLGGFSQGSMVALRLALSAAAKPAGLAILSGSLIDREGTARLVRQSPAFPVFQSHGSYDPVLAPDGAFALRCLLEGAGYPLSWQGFPGGHEINAAVLGALGGFLEGLSAGRRS